MTGLLATDYHSAILRRTLYKLAHATWLPCSTILAYPAMSRDLSWRWDLGFLLGISFVHRAARNALQGTDTFVCCCRYLSHFRSVHRGAYFAELRTTTVRKLMPEAWGFLCPVHTPDGSPCGLLNHFSAMCRLVTKRPESMEDTEVAINMVMQNGHAYEHW